MLDRMEWIAVGITIAPACGNTAADDICLYVGQPARTWHRNPQRRIPELKAYARRHGTLPVTRILLPDIGL